MFVTKKEGYLKANTILYAQNVCTAIEDMAGFPFQICKETLKESPFKSQYRLIIFISFSGLIQGTYLCALDDVSALKMIGKFKEGMRQDEIRDLRQEYGSYIKEVLSLSVGQSIVELEKNFGDLTFTPATIVFGEIEFPEILTCSIQIEGKPGKILCGFSINFANLKIGRKLEDALSDLKKKTFEAQEAQKNINSILELIPSGLAAIDQNGNVFPGYSKSFTKIIGYESDASIVGKNLCVLLGLDGDKIDKWRKWLDDVFTKYNEVPFREMVETCNINVIKNRYEQVLKCCWFPLSNNRENKLEKLLVVIDEVTQG